MPDARTRFSRTDEYQLKNMVLAGRCVAFVGAGLSVPPGKTWRPLVGQLAKRCDIAFDNEEPETEIFDRCIDKSESLCTETLKELFPRHIAATRTGISYLLRLKFRAVLTTNFDPWLRQQSTYRHYQKCHVYPDLPLTGSLQGRIYYLHGYFNSDDENASLGALVFGARSFQQAYDSRTSASLLPGFLLNTLVYENVVFICFNPLEPHIRRILEASMRVRRDLAAATRHRAGDVPKRFVLWPAVAGLDGEEREREETRITWIRSLDVVPVFYEPEAPDHRGLERLLDSWVDEGDLADRSAPFKSGFDLTPQEQGQGGLP